jgi:hypothetical protein
MELVRLAKGERRSEADHGFDNGWVLDGSLSLALSRGQWLTGAREDDEGLLSGGRDCCILNVDSMLKGLELGRRKQKRNVHGNAVLRADLGSVEVDSEVAH